MEFLLISAFAPLSGPPHGEYRLHTPSRPAAHSHKHRPDFYTLSCSVPVRPGSLGAPKWARRAPRSVHSAVPAPSLITQTVSGFLSSSPPPAAFPLPLPLPRPIRPPAPPPPIPWVPGWGGGEAGTAPRPHGRPSEPEAEGAPGGAGHRPAGPASAGPGPGAGLPRPPAGRGQPGERGIAVRPGEALLHTPPWADGERILRSS